MTLRTVVAVLLVAGCGPPGGGGTGGGGGSGAGGGSGTGGGGAGTGGGNVARGDAGSGLIEMAQTCFSNMGTESCSGSGYGYFFTGTGLPATCSETHFGECDVTECTFDGGSVPPSFNAGTMFAHGFRSGDQMFGFNVGQYHFDTTTRIWDGGEAITISAAGATVPAFTSPPLQAPGDSLSVIAPACPQFPARCALNRAASYSIAWSGVPAIEAQIISLLLGDRQTVIRCQFNASPGTIPAAAMAMLGSSDAGYDQAVLAIPANRIAFNIGDAGQWDVTMIAKGTLNFQCPCATTN